MDAGQCIRASGFIRGRRLAHVCSKVRVARSFEVEHFDLSFCSLKLKACPRHCVRCPQVDLPTKAKDWALQHACSGLLYEMLAVLELAERADSESDRRAADRLQRR